MHSQPSFCGVVHFAGDARTCRQRRRRHRWVSSALPLYVSLSISFAFDVCESECVDWDTTDNCLRPYRASVENKCEINGMCAGNHNIDIMFASGRRKVEMGALHSNFRRNGTITHISIRCTLRWHSHRFYIQSTNEPLDHTECQSNICTQMIIFLQHNWCDTMSVVRRTLRKNTSASAFRGECVERHAWDAKPIHSH